jgi:hypothetical protein
MFFVNGSTIQETYSSNYGSGTFIYSLSAGDYVQPGWGVGTTMTGGGSYNYFSGTLIG